MELVLFLSFIWFYSNKLFTLNGIYLWTDSITMQNCKTKNSDYKASYLLGWFINKYCFIIMNLFVILVIHESTQYVRLWIRSHVIDTRYKYYYLKLQRSSRCLLSALRFIKDDRLSSYFYFRFFYFL